MPHTERENANSENENIFLSWDYWSYALRDSAVGGRLHSELVGI
jgi:hypothetical protein